MKFWEIIIELLSYIYWVIIIGNKKYVFLSHTWPDANEITSQTHSQLKFHANFKQRQFPILFTGHENMSYVKN